MLGDAAPQALVNCNPKPACANVDNWGFVWVAKKFVVAAGHQDKCGEFIGTIRRKYAHAVRD